MYSGTIVSSQKSEIKKTNEGCSGYSSCIYDKLSTLDFMWNPSLTFHHFILF